MNISVIIPVCNEQNTVAAILKKAPAVREVPIRHYPRSRRGGKKIRVVDGLQAIWILLKYRPGN